ncbi:GrpB family protein [Amycolatopsis thermoflava]|uniref:GrpB-like predicted nucleotidyltransferase (UPF0157 family) n=1 Tax=Amycolatopsis thermoflava TaxID=84480 RepID=A0A3N2G6M9_9PSEU|nr:GrpB family protein [Amycolatopsis thermoflava]ROS32123.1 GrpB-like predicted nucleotidyltransferase (UPF0157 family) [Amycolatopsis thermoflava]
MIFRNRKPILGLHRGTVTLTEHDDKWAGASKKEAARVRALLTAHGIPATTEHVGSTAVTGMPAKPVIDVAVGVADADAVGEALVALRRGGLDYIKGANQPGMLFLASGGQERFFHYHLVVHNSHAWDRLVLFRDMLRRHRGPADEYADLKRELAARHPTDRGAYTRAKSSHVRAIEARAFDEAQRRGQARAIAEAVRRPISEWPPMDSNPPRT